MIARAFEDGAVSGRLSIAELYEATADDARRLAYLLTGDLQLSEDVVQDAFVKLTGRLLHLRDSRAFGAYLNRTVVNLCRMRFRRQRVESRYLAGQRPQEGTEAPDTEASETVKWALMQLPYRQRAAIVLRFYVDLPDGETAVILGCAPATVRSLISRGMVSMRELLEGSDG